MRFTSFAQNFEDFLIWRALKTVNAGFYVDVGAHHPVVDSVSKGFYTLGWRGIHIEPVMAYAELLRQDRPDEVVLQVALGAMEGVLDLSVIADTGLSTGVTQLAKQHEQTHGFIAQNLQVPMLTLKSILAPYIGQEIHWLKIDVEGYEAQVLDGWDSQANRPWLMVIEATEPMSRTESHAKWEHFLIAAQYEFVYFDGLNRFYVAAEHAELKVAFAAPINVFDEIAVNETASPQLWLGMKEQRDVALARVQAQAATEQHQLQEVVRVLTDKLDRTQTCLTLSEKLRSTMIDDMAQLQLRLTHAEVQRVQLEQQLAVSATHLTQSAHQLWQLQHSLSWRMTQPCRWFLGLLPVLVHQWLRRLASVVLGILTSWPLPKRRQVRTVESNRTIEVEVHSSDAPSGLTDNSARLEQEHDIGMKGRLRALARHMSNWPVVGRLVRIGIAVIRLPEERHRVQKQLDDQAQHLHIEAVALAAMKERLLRHEAFFATQMPKLARSLAELNQAQQIALQSNKNTRENSNLPHS